MNQLHEEYEAAKTKATSKTTILDTEPLLNRSKKYLVGRIEQQKTQLQKLTNRLYEKGTLLVEKIDPKKKRVENTLIEAVRKETEALTSLTELKKILREPNTPMKTTKNLVIKAARLLYNRLSSADEKEKLSIIAGISLLSVASTTDNSSLVTLAQKVGKIKTEEIDLNKYLSDSNDSLDEGIIKNIFKASMKKTIILTERILDKIVIWLTTETLDSLNNIDKLRKKARFHKEEFMKIVHKIQNLDPQKFRIRT